MHFIFRHAFALSILSIANSMPAWAENCPDAKAATRPFIVQRSDDWRLAVVHVDDTTVRTMLRSQGNTILETVEFQGLFQLDRIDRGRRKVFRPKGDLKSFFPIKVGKKIVAEFDTEESGKIFSTKIELVVRKADALYIGVCKYAVFQIQRSESSAGGPLQFFNYDYYSPDLKIVLAKEYTNAGRASTWIKYERIYSGDR